MRMSANDAHLLGLLLFAGSFFVLAIALLISLLIGRRNRSAKTGQEARMAQ